MTQHLLDEVLSLVEECPTLSAATVERRIERLKRMAAFYEAKAPNSEDGGLLFNSFVSALDYAVNIINAYDALTKKMAELAKEYE